MAIRTLTHYVRAADGSLAQATSVVLADANDEFGVRRNDTEEVVVDAGTVMTQVSVGVYIFTFEVESGVEYTYSVRTIRNDETKHEETTFFVNAVPITSLPLITTLEEADALDPGDLPVAFTDAEDEQRARWLAMGTIRFCQVRWQGVKIDCDQQLPFPRFDAARGYTTLMGWGGSKARADTPFAIKLAHLYESASLADGRRREITEAISSGLASQSVGKRSESYRPLMIKGRVVLCSQAEELTGHFLLMDGGMD